MNYEMDLQNSCMPFGRWLLTQRDRGDWLAQDASTADQHDGCQPDEVDDAARAGGVNEGNA